jgi:hypothetical protein
MTSVKPINPTASTLPMMMHTTLNQLRSLRLESMAQALEQQLTQSGLSAMNRPGIRGGWLV